MDLAQLEQRACTYLAASLRHRFRHVLPYLPFQRVAELPGLSEALDDMPATSSRAQDMVEALLGFPSNMRCALGASRSARSAAQRPWCGALSCTTALLPGLPSPQLHTTLTNRAHSLLLLLQAGGVHGRRGRRQL